MSLRPTTPAAVATALAAAMLGGLALVSAPVAASPRAAPCAGALPVAVRLPTHNARALKRLGIVQVVAGARVRDVHVMLKRGGRIVAQGARAAAFTGSAAVTLAFAREPRAGGGSLVVSGRRAGCAKKRTTTRALALGRNDLPVKLTAVDSDVSDGTFAVRLRRTSPAPVSELRLRVIDARGATIAERVRDAPLGEPLRIDVAPRERPAAGRYGVLVTAALGGDGARGVVAETIDLGPVPPPASEEGEPAPPPGAVVQQVAVGWSQGMWQGADTAGFSIPGIGEGQLVCRPDTQWLRVFPSDRSRDVAMMLRTSRDWGGGDESALREAQMTPFTGPDFNEGMNKFTPPEKRSHGTFEGVIGDGLPAAGTFGAGRLPTEVRLSWTWDFEDPAAASCAITATLTSQGPGNAGAAARGLTLGWHGESGVPADTTLATGVPGLGVVRLRCDPRPEGVRQLAIDPQAPLPGLALTTFEGSDRSDRALGDVPYVVPLPNNGLVTLATPSGTPLRLLLSSRWKVNDPDPAENFCRLSGLAVAG